MVMMNSKAGARSVGVVTGLAAALFLALGTAAWADPDMGGHHGMDKGYGHGMGHCMEHGMGHGMSPMEPHNAATHFLKMAPMLKLTDAQVQQLTKLRNQYIDNNAKTEEMLKAAHSDLARAMFSDDVDVQQTTALVDNIGKMESQLWHAYLQQLHDIKGLLTAEQKQTLKDMWKHPHRGMKGGKDEKHGDMPMGHGDMGHDDMHMSM
jgi:Spy/CpxP family protein refolding chaperone